MKRKYIITICIIAIVSLFMSVSAFADTRSFEEIHFVANAEQIDLLNELLEKDPIISEAEIIQQIAPDVWAKLNASQKEFLSSSPMLSLDINEVDQNSASGSEMITASSNISGYGKSIKFSSTTYVPGANFKWQIVTTRLADSKEKVHGYVLESTESSATLTAYGILDPPTGTYFTYGNHMICIPGYTPPGWSVWGIPIGQSTTDISCTSSADSGIEFISKSKTMSYVNPY